MEGKTLRRGKFSDESGKRHEKGQQAVYDQNMTAEKSWVMMMDRTDKEHEEYMYTVCLKKKHPQHF